MGKEINNISTEVAPILLNNEELSSDLQDSLSFTTKIHCSWQAETPTVVQIWPSFYSMKPYFLLIMSHV